MSSYHFLWLLPVICCKWNFSAESLLPQRFCFGVIEAIYSLNHTNAFIIFLVGFLQPAITIFFRSFSSLFLHFSPSFARRHSPPVFLRTRSVIHHFYSLVVNRNYLIDFCGFGIEINFRQLDDPSSPRIYAFSHLIEIRLEYFN